MKEILEKHPDLKELLELYPECHTYKILSGNEMYKEYWKRDKKGHWVDVTEVENLKITVRIEKEKLHQALLAERAKQAKEAKQ